MRTPFTIYNTLTGFMEAKNANGSWAGPNNGWTEGKKRYHEYIVIYLFLLSKQGDKWAYSFNLVHDIPGFIRYRGGNLKFIESLDDHFNGGHNDHSNEVRCRFPILKNSAKIFFCMRSFTAIASYSLSVFTCWGSL